jgi:lipopolysaccharide transport system permease protein
MKNREISINEPRSGWQIANWRELKRYKDLLFFLVWKDIKVLYKQTVLGFLWAIIQPFFTMIIFSVVFGKLARVPSDGIPYPIFSFAALLPWTYFANSLAASSQSLVTNANMITKVYFPRLFLPMAPVMAKLVDFAISFLMLIAMMLYFKVYPNFGIFVLPYLLILLIMIASGAGMWLTSLSIQYRDIKFIMTFFIQLLMYAAPVVWPVSLIPDKYRLIAGFYPMIGIIDGFRSALLGQPISWDLIFVGSCSSFLIFITGALYFRRTERIFADVA